MENCEEGFAALRLPFGLPFGREHFVVAALCAPHTALSSDSCCSLRRALRGWGWCGKRGKLGKAGKLGKLGNRGNCGTAGKVGKAGIFGIFVTDKGLLIPVNT